MKKKFLLIPVALVCALCCALGLAACSGNKTKFSVAQFNDEGITQIYLQAASLDEYEQHKDDEQPYNGFRPQGSCYQKYDLVNGELKIINKFETIELGGGEWYGILTLGVDSDYSFNDLKLEVNGEEKEFLRFDGIFNGDYFAEVGWFSGDTQIKIKGNTKINTFTPVITLKDYEANKDKQDSKDLRFKAAFGDLSNFGPTSYDTPIEYNSKTELTATELKTVLESREFTCKQAVKVTAYFEGKSKFFAEITDALAFFNSDASVGLNINTANKEVTWEADYRAGWSITLEYAKLTTTPAIKNNNFGFSAVTGEGANAANVAYASSTIAFSDGDTFEMFIPGMNIEQSGTYTQDGESVTMVITKRTYTVNGYHDVPIDGGSETLQCTYDGRNLVTTYGELTLTFVNQRPQ